MENLPEDVKALKKLQNKSLSVPGTRANPQHGTLLTSTGIPSLDQCIGGGIAIGTILLVEDDTFSTYGEIIMKYFLAEGVVCNHSLYIGSKDINPQKLMTKLPALVEEENTDKSSEVSDEKMTIAWRYQNLPTTQEKRKLILGHNYDLSKYMSKENIEHVPTYCWDDSDVNENPIPDTFLNPSYHKLLQDIKDHITKCQLEVDSVTEKRRTVLRIALHNLGSPMWLPVTLRPILSTRKDRDLDMFLFCLKALLRCAYAVAIVTIPSAVISKESIERCIHTTDCGIRLISFMGTENENNPALSDYNGFLKITKLPSLNTLEEPITGNNNSDLAFKLRRKKFVIEKLHLPPEMEDSSQREQDELPQLSCSAFKSKIDF